jgi:myo-inositol 2-dehydrogenase/D-chiro-inositol 1-dehydrogenase
MRIGVIGVGRIGVYHARVLKEHPDVSALMLTDADNARAAQVAGDIGAESAPTVAELLDKVDAVVISSSTDTHAPMIHQAVDAGKPAFCEKPVALDLKSTREVVNHVRDADAIVQIGFQRRFDAGYIAAREAVSAGSIGTIYNVRIAGHDPAPPHEGYLPGSGGIFRDLHIHDFDIVRWVLGQDVTEVFVKGSVLVDPMFGKYDDVDTTAATLAFSGGALGVMTGSRHDPLGYDIRLEVFGSKDTIVAGWDSRTPMRSIEPNVPASKEKPYSFFLDRFGKAYTEELRTFVDVAQRKIPNPCGVEDAEIALRVALACDVSRKANRPVAVEEIQA